MRRGLLPPSCIDRYSQGRGIPIGLVIPGAFYTLDSLALSYGCIIYAECL